MTTRPNPVEAEAVGQSHITATFAGRDWSIPLDVDTWPTDRLLGCVAVNTETNKLTANPRAILDVLRIILGDQWQRFQAVAPRRRDLVAASHAFAEAVGIPKTASTMDVAFGGIPRLLFELEQHESAIEATLPLMGLDYLDRFRFTAGRRNLTLRKISNRLAFVPYDSPLAIVRNDGQRPLSDAALVVMDLFEATTKTVHPARPLTAAQKAERQAEERKHAEQLAAYQKRREAEKQRREGPLDKAKANAQEARKVAHA